MGVGTGVFVFNNKLTFAFSTKKHKENILFTLFISYICNR